MLCSEIAFRRAQLGDLPAIVKLLADDPLGHDLAPRWPFPCHPFSHRAAVDQLRDEILAVFELADIVDRQDMRMIQCGRELRLALEPAACIRIRELVRKEFDGYRAVEFRVECTIDYSHPAFGELAFDAVGADYRARSNRRA